MERATKIELAFSACDSPKRPNPQCLNGLSLGAEPPRHSCDTWGLYGARRNAQSKLLRVAGSVLRGPVLTWTSTPLTTTTPARAATKCCHIAALALGLRESEHTLYKWSAVGYPAFPRRRRLRNTRIAVTCRSMKSWMNEVAS